jgi:hypothetical protein
MNTVLLLVLGVIALCIALIIIILRFAYKAKDGGVRVTMLVAVLYPIGELLQRTGLGPTWLRWHLSDFGVASCVCFMAIVAYQKLTERLTSKAIWNCQAVLVAATTLAVSHEAFQYEDGAGDIIDTAAYLIGSFISFVALWHTDKKIHAEEYRQPVAPPLKKRGARHTAPKRKR